MKNVLPRAVGRVTMSGRKRGLAISALAVTLVLGPQLVRVGAQQTPEALQQLVAPVALYPDELLAEVLAAATYPADADQAARWLQANASLTSDQIAAAVDRMAWDASVKALTEFPSVLANLEQNLSWASALGDAYYNQPNDVMDAVQVLRQRALAAGTLQSNAQITVSNQNGLIVIEPANAQLVYVPTYDCWNDFGAPIAPWPDFVFAPGFARGPIVWGGGFHLGGAWGGVSWGWHHWGFDWPQRRVLFQRQSYISHSPSVIDRHYAPRAPEPAGRVAVVRPRTAAPAPKVVARPKTPSEDSRNNRGFPPAKPAAPPTGTHSGAMSGFSHGGAASRNASRGQASMGGRSAPAHAGGGGGRR